MFQGAQSLFTSAYPSILHSHHTRAADFALAGSWAAARASPAQSPLCIPTTNTTNTHFLSARARESESRPLSPFINHGRESQILGISFPLARTFATFTTSSFCREQPSAAHCTKKTKKRTLRVAAEFMAVIRPHALHLRSPIFCSAQAATFAAGTFGLVLLLVVIVLQSSSSSPLIAPVPRVANALGVNELPPVAPTPAIIATRARGPTAPARQQEQQTDEETVPTPTAAAMIAGGAPATTDAGTRVAVAAAAEMPAPFREVESPGKNPSAHEAQRAQHDEWGGEPRAVGTHRFFTRRRRTAADIKRDAEAGSPSHRGGGFGDGIPPPIPDPGAARARAAEEPSQ
jgi:hypothetical protein